MIVGLSGTRRANGQKNSTIFRSLTRGTWDKTLYYLKFINSSYTKQYAIILVVVGMRPNGEWGIITAYPTFVNTGMSWWNHKSQFPDWMANYGEFGGQVTGPYNLSGFPNP